MSDNPDNKTYLGLGPQYKQEGTTLDGRYLIPSQGMLRFVEREVMDEASGLAGVHRILQQWQWCAETGEFNWYDIPLVGE